MIVSQTGTTGVTHTNHTDYMGGNRLSVNFHFPVGLLQCVHATKEMRVFTGQRNTRFSTIRNMKAATPRKSCSLDVNRIRRVAHTTINVNGKPANSFTMCLIELEWLLLLLFVFCDETRKHQVNLQQNWSREISVSSKRSPINGVLLVVCSHFIYISKWLFNCKFFVFIFIQLSTWTGN